MKKIIIVRKILNFLLKFKSLFVKFLVKSVDKIFKNQVTFRKKY